MKKLAKGLFVLIVLLGAVGSFASAGDWSSSSVPRISSGEGSGGFNQMMMGCNKSGC